jgi:hypothetical protein
MRLLLFGVRLSLLLSLAFGCSPKAEPTVGSESHFLSDCDGSCASGLSCLCGVCTSSCVAPSDCVAFDGAATCVSLADRGTGTTCAQADATAFCDVPCSSSTACTGLDPRYSCNRGYCRSDPLSRPNEPFAGYGVLCQQKSVSCATTTTPPGIVGSYTGQATVVLSSNALWGVSDLVDFGATITDQSNGLVNGTISIPSFDVGIQDALIRGQAPALTLYDSTVVDQNGCNLEVRVVVSATLGQNQSPAVLTGTLALRFTGNFTGTACTTEQVDEYPTTGANFELTATLTP